MNTTQQLLLQELRVVPMCPNDLQARLRGWDHEVDVSEVVAALRSMHRDGLVDGPGISRLHRQPVWLTTAGKTRARWEVGDTVGRWRRVA
jgi:hypothetical protein